MPNTDDILVSVGLPVYNGAAELRRALDTLLAQTHRHLEIIVSDNASTDATPKIIAEFAARDPRIVVLHNPTNIGGGPNFVRTIEAARGEFFMWAAHDDWWAPTFVEENLRVLRACPNCIASMSQVNYMDGQRKVWMPFIERADYRALIGSVAANVRHYVANSGMNSRFYALFRRDVLRRCLPFEGYVACDNALIVRTLAYGKYGEVNRPLFFRGMGGESARHLSMLTSDKSFPGCFLPLWRYSRNVWRMPHVKRDAGLVIALLTCNTIFCAMLVIALVKDRWRRVLGK